jgi:hypothetical protein
MARDKKKKPTARTTRMGYDKSEAEEELVAEALKRKDMDTGRGRINR